MDSFVLYFIFMAKVGDINIEHWFIVRSPDTLGKIKDKVPFNCYSRKKLIIEDLTHLVIAN